MNAENSLHPVTKQLLEGTLKLSEISLPIFDKDRIIYPTAKEARAKGYEAEHLKSTSIQICEYNIKNGTNYDVNNRALFQKETGALDDRCYRLTKFEHIVRHYLKAQKDERELKVFIRMKQFHYKKLSNFEKDTLKSFKEWAETCEKGLKKNSEFAKELFKDKTSNFYKNWHKRLKEGHATETAHINISDARKNFYKNISPEQKKYYFSTS